MPEAFRGWLRHSWLSHLQSVVATENQCFIEPCKSSDIRNQILGFENEISLLDNDRSTAYKEVMMRLDSVRWQKRHKFRNIIHIQNQVLNLINPLETLVFWTKMNI